MRTFASLKELSIRMKSVANVQKITKTMKMVAAAKLKGVQSAMEGSRPFSRTVTGFFSELDEQSAEGDDAPKSELLLCITSDRGLCGAINGNVAKYVKSAIADNTAAGLETPLIILGERGLPLLNRDYAENIKYHYAQVGLKPSFLEASLIASSMLDAEFDKARIVYNRFVSALVNEVEAIPVANKDKLDAVTKTIKEKYEFDSDCLVDLYEYNLAVTLYSTILENATSEQSARMTAMESATKNAGEMVDALSLKYNKGRQASITNELMEIVSGAESLK